ncbi:peptidylprolyl isomerase [Pontibacter locisalis]|uniref:peptidylprolyl isomerase n=1 Tax=Pontibacter locisalis TaxID=1719035 RepID=A0ABW5ILZ6_9BACT
MKKKTFLTSITRALLVATFILPFSSCNQPDSETGDTSKEVTEAETELEPLTTETAVEVLTAYEKEHPDSIAVISTRHGDIKVRLYKDTPLHRANFVRLTKAGFYDQGEFYRVVKGFAIQGGDSDNREMSQGAYKIPQETNPKYVHKKGALAMARYGDERNPDKESSSHNFYIVLGEPLTDAELRAYEAEHNIQYTPEQMEAYKTIGGEPGLDTEYTVFGEVIEGMDVVEKIGQESVGSGNWPTEIVPHKIKMVKE